MTDVQGLVVWLRQQLDEDEQTIRTWDAACVHIEACGDTGDFMDRFDGVRLSAEVEAKRRLLQQFELRGNAVRATVQPSTGGVWDDLLRMLALPYADRPGYREEWRP